MGIFESFGEKQATKLIKHYTGESIFPTFIATCDASITPDWRGVVVLDNKNLWLVNRLGARGVAYENLVMDPKSGQYPEGSRGYPKYRFGFVFLYGEGDFVISPLTREGGQTLGRHLADVGFRSEEELLLSTKSFEGTNYDKTKDIEKRSKNIESPEFKICSMCAEPIKSAAKKCRFCQHMQEKV